MTRERLYLYDTTLRDGQQSQGVDFSAEDKARIARALDGLGIDYVEGGWPGANPTDSAFFAAPPELGHATLTAFGMTKRAGRSAENDEVLAGGRQRRHPGGLPRRQDPRLPRHRPRSASSSTRTSPTSASRSPTSPRRAARRCSTPSTSSTAGRRTPTTPSPACKAALDAGARWIVLCDTNGGTLPAEVGAITARGRSPPASPATGSASTPTTTPATPWPTRSPPSTPARGRSRAR